MLINTSNRIHLNDRPLIRLYTDKNKQKFKNELLLINWSNMLSPSTNVNDSYNKFIAAILKAYEKCFPLTRMSRRACKDKKWVTKGLKKSSKVKNKLYKTFLLTKNPTDEMKYRNYKRIYRNVVRRAEVLYYNEQFDSKINNAKQIWSNLNRVCSAKKNKKTNVVVDKLIVDGCEIVDYAKISDAFNKYYCNVGPSLVKHLPTTSATFIDYLHPSILNSISVESVTIDELFLLINTLKCNKSCGPDGISPQLIKDNSEYLCEPLAYLFNLSLTHGVVPDNLKIAKVVPIFKKGDVHLTSNYRPISLLSIFNKLLEKLVYKRLYGFFEKNHVLYSHQFGFRRNHSTSMALIEVIDSCYENLDKNYKGIGIHFDLQKAFDTVDHQILLHKLYNYGVRGIMYNWIKDYLTNRKQFTAVNNVSSTLGDIVCGVPQGSVLGPLLFLIYINDISIAVPDEKLKLFADDTNLFIFGSDWSVVEKRANICLKKMEKWFIANKLSLNAEKTCYTAFSCRSKQPTPLLDLYINNQKLVKVDSCKYLGVIIDDSLKWDLHIDNICKKLLKFTSIFYKMRSILPKTCLKNLYFAFIQPHILYGIEVYANTYQASIDKLCKLNNKLLRILLNKKLRTPIMDLYTELNTLPIPLLHEYQLLIFVFKCFFHKNLMPGIFHSYFTVNSSIHSYNTRQCADLHSSSVSTTFGKRNVVYRGSILWNNLPDHFKLNSSLNTCKKNIKTFLSNRTSSV